MQTYYVRLRGDGCWSKASARAVVDNSSCCMGSPAHRRIKVTPVLLCAAAQHPAARTSQTGHMRAAAAVDHEVHALGAHSTRKNSASKLDLAAGNGGQHALEWRWASRVSDPIREVSATRLIFRSWVSHRHTVGGAQE